MTRLKSRIVSGGLLVLSVAITYLTFNLGFSRATAGETTAIWIPLGAFLFSVGLVFAAIIVELKQRDNSPH